MRLRALRAFLAVHRTGTVAAAAELVHLSAAAVSVQLKELEAECGATLFVRTPRSLKLNAVGHRLVPLAQQMLALHAQMRELCGLSTVSGLLRLGVIGSALAGVLPAMLQRMTEAHPQLDIKVVAGNSAELLEQLDGGVLDAVIVTHSPERYGAGVQAQVLYVEPFVLLTPRPIAAEDLAGVLASAPYVAFDRATWAGRMIEDYLGGHGLSVRPAMELNSLDAIAAVVRHGLGVSIVPRIRGAHWWREPLTLGLQPLPRFDRPVALVERRSSQRQWLGATLKAALDSVDPVEPETPLPA